MQAKVMVMIMTMAAMINGENKVVRLKLMLHKLKMMMMDPFNINLKCLIQEYIKWFNEIIPLTIYLEASKEV